MKKMICSLLVITALCACDRVVEATHEVANESGELVGETLTEFGDGVASGVENATALEIDMSQELEQQGLSLGKISLDNTDYEATDNVLEVYVIFEADFNDTINVKVFDENDLEMGRSTLVVSGAAGEATFFDFTFDKRTNITLPKHAFILRRRHIIGRQ